MTMVRYSVQIEGLTPVIFHKDNLAFSEKVKAWQKAPENKMLSQAGDDRSPAWTWLGCLYSDGHHISIDSDCMMTTVREGGAKVPTGLPRGEKTYKKVSQSGLMFDSPSWDFYINGVQIPIEPFNALIGELDFTKHIDTAEQYGFELLIKRAKIGMAKHVRVRPLFRNWMATNTLTVFDEESSGLEESILNMIFAQAGAYCGLCDWRPSSPKSPGSFGKFKTTLKRI